MTPPVRWPIVGNAPAFRADTTGFLLRVARHQGDVATFQIGRRPAWLLSHPDQVRAVLVDRADEFHKGRLIHRARRLLGDGLLTSEGEMHRRRRRQIQPAFGREQLHRALAPAVAIVAARAAHWRAPKILLDREMDELALSVVSRALLGAAIDEQIPTLRRSLHRLGRWAPLLMAPGGRFFERVPIPAVGRLRSSIDVVERAIQRCVEGAATDAPLLKAMQLGSDGPMPAQQIRDEVMTIFLAGHDTTAAALLWIWILLAEHPECEQRLHDELDELLPGRDATPEDLTRLKWTSAVIDETLRLFPPIGRIGRRPLHDVALDGVTLRKDASVFLSPFVTHRDARWYPEPESFRPDRWLESVPGRPRFAWFPFGAGPRSCIGEHFARVVLMLTVATVARRWKLRPVVPGVPAPRSLLTVKPRGAVWMALERRPGYRESGS